jgi:hypothetical protein
MDQQPLADVAAIRSWMPPMREGLTERSAMASNKVTISIEVKTTTSFAVFVNTDRVSFGVNNKGSVSAAIGKPLLLTWLMVGNPNDTIEIQIDAAPGFTVDALQNPTKDHIPSEFFRGDGHTTFTVKKGV